MHVTLLSQEFSIQFESIKAEGDDSLVTFQILDGGAPMAPVMIRLQGPPASLDQRVAAAEQALMQKFADMTAKFHQARSGGYR